jgi:hypothetical protein
LRSLHACYGRIITTSTLETTVGGGSRATIINATRRSKPLIISQGCAASRGAGTMAANIERSIFPKTLLVAAILKAGVFAAAPGVAASMGAAAQTQGTQAKEYPYYVEFRVAVDGVYGHSYIAYGHLDSLGRTATATYADIHPTGDSLSALLGHFFPMEAATIPEKDTLGYKIARRFRRPLTAVEYDRLNLVISHIRAARHSWSVLAYNCNDFVARNGNADADHALAALRLHTEVAGD